MSFEQDSIQPFDLGIDAAMAHRMRLAITTYEPNLRRYTSPNPAEDLVLTPRQTEDYGRFLITLIQDPDEPFVPDMPIGDRQFRRAAALGVGPYPGDFEFDGMEGPLALNAALGTNHYMKFAYTTRNEVVQKGKQWADLARRPLKRIEIQELRRLGHLPGAVIANEIGIAEYNELIGYPQTTTWDTETVDEWAVAYKRALGPKTPLNGEAVTILASQYRGPSVSEVEAVTTLGELDARATEMAINQKAEEEEYYAQQRADAYALAETDRVFAWVLNHNPGADTVRLAAQYKLVKHAFPDLEPAKVRRIAEMDSPDTVVRWIAFHSPDQFSTAETEQLAGRLDLTRSLWQKRYRFDTVNFSEVKPGNSKWDEIPEIGLHAGLQLSEDEIAFILGKIEEFPGRQESPFKSLNPSRPEVRSLIKWICTELHKAASTPDTGGHPTDYLKRDEIFRGLRLFGISRPDIVKIFGAKNTFRTIQSEFGIVPRYKFRDMGYREGIEKGIALARRLGRRPTVADLDAARETGDFTSSHTTRKRYGTLINFYELIGLPYFSNFKQPDVLDWGVAYKIKNGADRAITETDVLVLAGRDAAPALNTIERFYTSAEAFDKEVDREYQRIQQEQQAVREELLAIIEARCKNDPELAQVVEPLTGDARIRAAVLLRLARKFIPHAYPSERRDIAVLSDPDSAVQRILEKAADGVKAGSVEAEASRMGVFDVLWPMYRFMNVPLELEPGAEQAAKEKTKRLGRPGVNEILGVDILDSVHQRRERLAKASDKPQAAPIRPAARPKRRPPTPAPTVIERTVPKKTRERTPAEPLVSPDEYVARLEARIDPRRGTVTDFEHEVLLQMCRRRGSTATAKALAKERGFEELTPRIARALRSLEQLGVVDARKEEGRHLPLYALPSLDEQASA